MRVHQSGLRHLFREVTEVQSGIDPKVVRDWTRNPSYTMVSNDVKDVRDIVIGITGDETIGDHVLLHLGHMIFGQFLVWGPLVIRCVPDEDAQSLYLKGENDADH